MKQKLFLVVRSDLSIAQQAVQIAHALSTFYHEHRLLEDKWYKDSQHLVLVSVPNRIELLKLVEKARRKGAAFSVFCEPDIGNEITAVALEHKAKNLCSRLPLAFLHAVNNASDGIRTHTQ